jgi:hypothetical protein
MAVSTVPAVSAAMSAKAERLAALLPTLSRGRSKETGVSFYVVPSSNRMTAHWTAVDGSGCTCVGYQRRGTCTHALAAASVERSRRQTPGAEHAPTSSPTSWRPCSRGCGALLPPEQTTRMCDGCFERLARALDVIE